MSPFPPCVHRALAPSRYLEIARARDPDECRPIRPNLKRLKSRGGVLRSPTGVA
ncbi:hypothetical protein DGo_PB0082 (plasmid) [Deinococcus gobiensis I-0]|uniref:Uncharacterized protein n=1 Tax=Deinococcus gobiensis (strain DSM 21396 / JCM 16679 / CGMCC 1.7299 / I-0) TaxID=745776 RepID=H8H1F4_DEIGI|nr:hypothetical protein DGo_PB0082 [Deinococcus gobiensis I-0]